ncbi:hypothetical protein ACEV8N_23915, partial [Vibrio parahaemolyticus]
HEALDFFKKNPPYGIQENTSFKFSEDKIFSPLTEFLALSFEANDTISRNNQALSLFQKLLGFHINTKNRAALLAVELERIQWLHQK